MTLSLAAGTAAVVIMADLASEAAEVAALRVGTESRLILTWQKG